MTRPFLHIISHPTNFLQFLCDLADREGRGRATGPVSARRSNRSGTTPVSDPLSGPSEEVRKAGDGSR